MRNTKWLKNGKLRRAILSAFYNISQRNFGILLILWCSFKLWWNFCLDQNFSYKGKGPLVLSNVSMPQILLLYSKCQGSIFLFADWSKPYHVQAHKTSCSLLALMRGQPVNNSIYLILVSKFTPITGELFHDTSYFDTCILLLYGQWCFTGN